MSHGVHDARLGGIYARGNRRSPRRDRGNVQGTAEPGARQAARRARGVRGGMETMTDPTKGDMNDDGTEYPRDDAFDAWIASVAPTLNAPKAAPRAEMWDAIQARQQTARDAQAGRIPGVTPLRRHWRLLSVIAAALLLGVAIDRLVQRGDDRSVATVPSTPSLDSQLASSTAHAPTPSASSAASSP